MPYASKKLLKNSVVLGLLLLSACKEKAPQTLNQEAEATLWKQANQYFKVLSTEPKSPTENPTTPEKVKLGQMLFHDPRLSKSGLLSCNSCHNLANYGVDNLQTSPGHQSQAGARNAPTVFNTSLHFAQFWDGRAADLESQASGPLLNPVEMALEHEDDAVKNIQHIPGYIHAFSQAFPGQPEPISYQNILRSIAAFERTLLTPSPFDRYLAGDKDSLSQEAKQGLQTYLHYGCQTCHNGMGLGGNLYQKFGVIHAYPHQKDTGRFDITQQTEDHYVFKVPSLRNVARTAPYFHDGKVQELEEAVTIMAKTQLGKEMPLEDAQKIAHFLEALTGDIPEQISTSPQIPN